MEKSVISSKINLRKCYGFYLLVCVASIAWLTALAHMSCIVLGPGCYAFQMAPPQIVESAKQGTLLAPVGTTFVSGIFVLWGCYALSAASIIRKLPLLNIAVYLIAAICIIRGLLGIQLWIRFPDSLSTYASAASVIWLLSGLMYLVGYRHLKKQGHI